MRSITAAFLAWVLVVSAQPPASQRPAPATSQRPQVYTATKGDATFKVTKMLVVEDLILKDKGGNPIEGLKASDFVVTEDGKPQKVEFCEFQKLEETAEPVPEPAPAPEKQLQKREEAPPPPAAKSATANQIAPEKPGDIKYKDRRLMVMFFDMTSMPIDDQNRAQKAAEKFLKTQMTKSDLMAIMTFSNDIKVVEDFTDDRDQLMKDVKNLTIGEGQGFETSNSDDSSADTAAAFQQDDTEFNIFNTGIGPFSHLA